MLCRRHLSGLGSYFAPAEYAVDGLEGVALLPGLAGHEPTLVCVWPAVLAGAGLVGVYPSAVADDVAAVAAGLSTVCV
jgi:hypothetical protein